jgi:trehalose 6-phosphate synthase/phosphatase
VTLWAEHGFWQRPASASAWFPAASVPSDWLDRVHPILEQFTASTPGSLIEKKTASVAWHYRLAEVEFGARQAHELRMLLGDALSNQPLEVLEGKKVIEVRLRGITKALAARHVLASEDAGMILAVGDDRTDEDLFAALPPPSITIAVGTGTSRARYRLGDASAVRRLLRTLLDAGSAADLVQSA